MDEKSAYRPTVDGPVDNIDCFECPARMGDLCKGLSDLSIPALYKSSKGIKLEKGRKLSLDDHYPNHIFSVKDGTVMLYRMGADGQRQILKFLFAGDIIGLTSGQTYGISAEACTKVGLCCWEREIFEDFLILFPAMDKQFHIIASKALTESYDHIYYLGQLGAQQRVAAFILSLAQRQEDMSGTPDTLLLAMTRLDIADYLGLTIETVSRELTKLKSKGFVALPSLDRLHLLNVSALQDLAEGR
jgi:CRP/FNR family transcriptional regulator